MIERVFRERWRRVLASLVGYVGDFDLAEESTQKAGVRVDAGVFASSHVFASLGRPSRHADGRQTARHAVMIEHSTKPLALTEDADA